jgi:hypothetical protein
MAFDGSDGAGVRELAALPRVLGGVVLFVGPKGGVFAFATASDCADWTDEGVAWARGC